MLLPWCIRSHKLLLSLGFSKQHMRVTFIQDPLLGGERISFHVSDMTLTACPNRQAASSEIHLCQLSSCVILIFTECGMFYVLCRYNLFMV